MLVPVASGPDVVALVPTLALSERLVRCVESVASSDTSLRIAVLVIVNSPAAELDTPPLPPGVEVVQAGLNLGWAGGLRFGRTLVEAPFLWLVQDDMTVSADALAVLHDALVADPELGVVSPVEVDADGMARAGSWGGVLSADGELAWLPVQAMGRPLPSTPTHLDYVPSRGMLVRTSVWDDVGGMDPRYYPVMWADVDFCFAVAQLGRHVALVTRAEVAHTQKASTGQPWAEFLFERNRELFLSTWRPDLPLDRRRSAVTSVRPVPAAALTGAVDPAVPPALLAEVAQAAADTTLHLGRFLGRVTSESDEALARSEAALAAADATIARLEGALDVSRREHEAERLVWQARAEELIATIAEREEERARLLQQLAARQQELDDARAESGRRQQRIAELLSSTSWRLTRPVRLLSELVGRAPSPSRD